MQVKYLNKKNSLKAKDQLKHILKDIYYKNKGNNRKTKKKSNKMKIECYKVKQNTDTI